MDAPKKNMQGGQHRRMNSPLKKLKPLKRGKSKPEMAKLSVTELLQRTMLTSTSMSSKDTILVSESRIKTNIDDYEDRYHDFDSQISPGRGLGSNRSWGSTSLDGSEFTQSTRMTQKELVTVIKNRAERNLDPPSFVTPIAELLPMQISWDHKLPPNHNKMRPQVNIIGCLHPLELVLAQADVRLRHQQETMSAKKKICQDKVKQIDDAIQLKYTRAERYALLFEQKQRQIQWMKIIKLSMYISLLYTNTKRHVVAGTFFSHSVHAAFIIRQACKRFMKRHMLHKFKFKFMVLFRRKEFIFRMAMRIQRKRNALIRIKTFLSEFRNHHQMNVVVHKYLMGVRKVQRNIRDFIACKHAKVTVLGVIWARLERNYVKHMLEKRKQQKRTTGKMKATDEEFADMDRKTLIEMKNQAKLWERIDTKMEEKIKILKATGVIVLESDEELTDKYMLSPKARWAALNDMLMFLRKEFYQSQRAVIRKKIDAESAFTECHALDLLKGRNADIARIVLEKFDKRLVTMKYKPFMLFSSINPKLVHDRIVMTHNKHETFAIKIGEFSSTASAKYIKAQSRKEKSSLAMAGTPKHGSIPEH